MFNLPAIVDFGAVQFAYTVQFLVYFSLQIIILRIIAESIYFLIPHNLNIL